MTADTFLSMLLAWEWDYHAQAAIVRLTRNAAFRYKAYLEQIDYATNWGFERNHMERLVTLDFVYKGRTSSLPALQVRGKAI
jgi:transposition helper protein, IS21 family